MYKVHPCRKMIQQVVETILTLVKKSGGDMSHPQIMPMAATDIQSRRRTRSTLMITIGA